MSHFYLLPTSLVVPLLVSLVLAISARSRHTHLVDTDIYRLPKSIAYLMAICGALFLGALFIPGIQGTAAPLWFDACWLAFSIAPFIAAIVFANYRVVLSAESLNVRIFRERIILLAEIVDTDLLRGRARELIVYTRDGHRLRLSGLLQDFDDLVIKIQNARSSPTDSVEKLDDQRRAAEGWKGANWILGAGLVVIGTAAIAAWITQR